MTRTNTRKAKHAVNRLRKLLTVGAFFEGCSGHPCRVTEKEFYSRDLYGNGVFGQSLVDESFQSCSLLHCAPMPLTEEEAHKRAIFIKEKGIDTYMHEYDCTQGTIRMRWPVREARERASLLEHEAQEGLEETEQNVVNEQG